jgi:hypothetical protein
MKIKTEINQKKNVRVHVFARQVDFGMDRLYEQQLENRTPIKIQVFKEIKKAIEWIDQGKLR